MNGGERGSTMAHISQRRGKEMGIVTRGREITDLQGYRGPCRVRRHLTGSTITKDEGPLRYTANANNCSSSTSSNSASAVNTATRIGKGNVTSKKNKYHA